MLKAFSSEEASKVRLRDGLAMIFAMPLERGSQLNALAADQCIFCGSLASIDNKLTDEHVVPDGLGWDLVILRATCSSCQQKINPFEQRAMKTWFGIQREIFGIRSKKPSRRKLQSNNHVGATYSSFIPNNQIDMIELHKSCFNEDRAEISDLLENGGFYPVFPLPPGVLFGRDPNESMHYTIINTNNFKNLQEQAISLKVVGNDFFRLIAKIVHCFAYIFSRSNKIDFTLPEFIFSKDWSRPSYWIGASELSFETGTAHHVAIYTRNVLLKSVLGIFHIKAVVVTVGLFTGFGAPAYDVVVGYIRD